MIPIFVAVLRLLGKPVLFRALAVAIAVGIPAALLFSPAALHASELVRAVHASMELRLGLWGGWLLLAAPAARAAFDGPATKTLRSLRLPALPVLAAISGLAGVAHLPWFVLFLRGGGLAQGAATIVTAIWIETALIASHRKSQRIHVACAIAVIAVDPPALAGLLAATVGAVLCVRTAWAAVHEHGSSALHLARPTRPVLGLVTLYLLTLVRTARSRLSVATMMVALGTLGLLAGRANAPARPTQQALAIMTLPAILVAGLLTEPLVAMENRLSPLLRSLRTRRTAVVGAFLVSLATPGAALAATAGAVAKAPPPTTAAVVAWSVALAGAVGAWGRRLERRGRRTAAHFAGALLVVMLVAYAGVFAW